jgi:hypothetical protein
VRRALAKVYYRYRLHDDAMGTIAESGADGGPVGRVAVRADLWRTQDALAQVLDKVFCRSFAPLAGAIGHDGTGRGRKSNERISIAAPRLMRLGAPLLAPHVGPQFVKFQAASSDADDAAVVQLGTALPDLERQLADRLAVNADQARGRADAHALTEGGDDVDLFFTRQHVHGANP